MVDKHLIAKTDPVAKQANTILWHDFRLTLLSERLFRVEHSKPLIFRDSATQSVWFRNHPAVSHTKFEHPDCLEVKTDKCTLFVYKDGKMEVSFGSSPIPVDNKGNLGGTSRTLDKCDGETRYDDPFISMSQFSHVDLGNGIISKTGVAFFDDADSLSLKENGEIVEEKGVGYDKYVFAFENNYQAALDAFFSITGEIPMVPRFAFGNWWSRFHDYSDKEYLSVMNRLADADVPITVATIDMDWHHYRTLDADFNISKSGKNTTHYGGNFGWTGYSWNKKLFPDYKSFLKKLRSKNLAITLNLHPADGIRWFEDCYQDMANAMSIDPGSEERIKFDISNPTFINAYFNIIHKPYENDGVDFWWLDWQQGTKTSIKGLDPLWSLNHYHYLDIAKNRRIPLILSRYCGIGSHRYPLGFSADTFVTWKTLNFLPYFTSTASNIGYTYWSHDIGGHMLGAKDDELFVRSVQFGVFSPINRLHNTDFATMSKEPSFYRNGSGEIAKSYLRLRHRLIPLLYSHAFISNKHGVPLIKPLYYDYQNSKCFDYKNEYIFADSILVLPITEKRINTYYSHIKMFVPKGTWTDFFTGHTYACKEDNEIDVYRSLDDIPALVKEGSIIPLSLDKGNSVKNPSFLEIQVYSGNGSYSLYEDKDELSCHTHFTLAADGNNLKLHISFTGNKSVIPNNRVLKIVFKNIKKGKCNLFINNLSQAIEEYESEVLTYLLPYSPDKNYVLDVCFEAQSPIANLNEHVLKILLEAELDNDQKRSLLAKVNSCLSVSSIVNILNENTITKEYLGALLEGIDNY